MKDQKTLVYTKRKLRRAIDIEALIILLTNT